MSAPSTVQLLAVVRAPLTDMAVLPELASSPSWFTTPGCRVISCSKLRLLISSSSTCWLRDGSGLAAGLGVNRHRVVFDRNRGGDGASLEQRVEGVLLRDVEDDVLALKGLESPMRLQ
jgi:hypothetical protein